MDLQNLLNLDICGRLVSNQIIISSMGGGGDTELSVSYLQMVQTKQAGW